MGPCRLNFLKVIARADQTYLTFTLPGILTQKKMLSVCKVNKKKKNEQIFFLIGTTKLDPILEFSFKFIWDIYLVCNLDNIYRFPSFQDQC